MLSQLEIDNAINEIVRDSAKAIHSFSLLRNESTQEQLCYIQTKLDSVVPRNKQRLFGYLVAHTLDEIFIENEVPKIRRIQQTLNALVAAITHSGALISNHEQLEAKFYNAVLKGHYEQARLVLKDHQNTLGYTLWNLRWQIFITEEEGLGDGSVRLFEWITKGSKSKAPIFFASQFRILADKTLPNDHAISQVRKRYEAAPPGDLAFLDFLFFGETNSKCPLNELLRMFESVTIVDRYDQLKRVTVSALCAKSDDSSKLIRALKQIQKTVQSNELRYILECTSVAEIDTTTSCDCSQLIQAWDAYVLSKYDDCEKLALSSLKDEPTYFAIHDLLVKSQIYLQRAEQNDSGWRAFSIIAQLHTALHSVYTRSTQTDQALATLSRLATRLRIPSLCVPLTDFIHSHSKVSIHELERTDGYSVGIHGPRNWEHLAKHTFNIAYLQRLADSYPESISVKFFLKVHSAPDCLQSEFPTISRQRVNFFAGLACARQHQEQLAIKHLQKFLEEQASDTNKTISPFAVEEARRVLLSVLCSVGDALGVVALVVDVLRDRTPNLRRLHFREPLALCESNVALVAHKIGYPMLSGLANNDPHKISFALRTFLRSHKVTKPSQLIDNAECAKEDLVLLFLKACTLEVLSSLTEFDTVEDVENERIHLLRWINKHYPEEQRSVEEELLRINQQAQIREAIRNVDTSRVVLNILALREAEADLFSDVYYSYHVQKLVVEDDTDQDLVQARSAGSQRPSSITPLLFPGSRNLADALAALFKTAFLCIRDQFVDNSLYGIDACLSTRIRHGFIVEQIVRPFTENYIAVRRGGNEAEAVKLHWQQKLGCTADALPLSALCKIFEQISSEVEKLATLVKDEWLQCSKDASNSQAIFNYAFSDAEIELLRVNEIKHNGGFEGFLDIAFEALVKRTSKNLRSAQRQMEDSLQTPLESILNRIIEEAQRKSTLPNEAIAHLQSVFTQCRQDIETSIEEIKQWFNESDRTLGRNRKASLAAQAAVGVAEKLNPTYRGRIHAEAKASEYLIKGRFFPSVAHVACLLINNAIHHSLLSCDKQCIRLSVWTERNQICFMTTNKCIDSQIARASALRIREKSAALIAELDHDKLAREGESGFAKILAMFIYEFKGLTPNISATAKDDLIEIRINCETPRILTE